MLPFWWIPCVIWVESSLTEHTWYNILSNSMAIIELQSEIKLKKQTFHSSNYLFAPMVDTNLLNQLLCVHMSFSINYQKSYWNRTLFLHLFILKQARFISEIFFPWFHNKWYFNLCSQSYLVNSVINLYLHNYKL